MEVGAFKSLSGLTELESICLGYCGQPGTADASVHPDNAENALEWLQDLPKTLRRIAIAGDVLRAMWGEREGGRGEGEKDR